MWKFAIISSSTRTIDVYSVVWWVRICSSAVAGCRASSSMVVRDLALTASPIPSSSPRSVIFARVAYTVGVTASPGRLGRGVAVDAGYCCYLLWLAILFPAVSVPAFISLIMMLRYGIGAGMLTAIGLAAGYGLWAALDAHSFERWIAQPVRQRFQMWWRYTRTWDQVCALNGLAARHQDRTLTPLVRSIWIGKHTDVIDLRVVTGQSIDDWQKRTRELAAAWRADRRDIRATAPGEIRITITR